MAKKWKKVVDFVMKNGGWKKLAKPTVTLHGTAFPKTHADCEKLGVRFDFAGTIEKAKGEKWHRFQAQVNAGSKIPSTWKEWREKHKGVTHANVATIEVADGASEDEVRAALEKLEDEID